MLCETEGFSLGEYKAFPIAEGWGDTDWRAGVLLSGRRANHQRDGRKNGADERATTAGQDRHG